MIRQLWAFAWLRWHLLVNGVRGAVRRDTVEQISRVLALVAPAAIVVLSLGSIIALSIGGYHAGNALATGAATSPDVVRMVRAVLAAQLVMVVVMPMGIGSQSPSRYARVLLMPIDRRVLHFVDVASGLADPWLFVIAPGLLALVAGLAVAGAWSSAGIMLVAGTGVLWTLLSMGAVVSFLSAWLMRDRRRAEWSTLLFVAGISVAGLLPHLLATTQHDVEPSFASVEQALPRWTKALPSEMYGETLGANEPKVRLLFVAGLWAEAMFAYLLSGLLHRHLLDAGEGQGRRRTNRSLPGLVRLPLLSGAGSAVAVAQFRTGMRSVRGRLAVLLPGPMIGLLALVLQRVPLESPAMTSLAAQPHLVFGASLIFAIYALQPFMMNQFASDRAGLTLQMVLPLSGRELVWGKAVGIFGMFLAAAMFALVITAAATGGGAPLLWVSVGVAGAATFITLTPVASVMSAVLPFSADLSKTGSGGNPHPAALFTGTFLVLIAAAPPALILFVGTRLGQLVTLSASIGWAAAVTGLATPLLSLSAKAMTARRENIYLTR